MKASHHRAMQLLGDPGSPLYAEPLSMAEYYNAMLTGTRHIGYMLICPHCCSHDMMAKVYLQEKHQVIQKILGCLELRVYNGDIVVPVCLHTPTLVLPPSLFEEHYFDPSKQVPFASMYLQGSHSPIQPRGNNPQFIVPKNFWQPPTDVR